MQTARQYPHVQRDGFGSTHWTTVHACADNGTAGLNAREKLCCDYWYPVYAWLRRAGQHVGEPEDVTQDFFVYILNRPWFTRADQDKGKFRSFLLGSLERFLKDHQIRKNAFKRGARYPHIPFDFVEAHHRYSASEYLQASATEVYDVEWTTVLAERALHRLRSDYISQGQASLYDELKPFLRALGSNLAYQAAAQTLGISVDNFKVSVCRLRKLYGVALREEVARTVSCTDDVESEMRHMRDVFARW